jgi:hypothetical protein
MAINFQKEGQEGLFGPWFERENYCWCSERKSWTILVYYVALSLQVTIKINSCCVKEADDNSKL